MRKIFLFLCAVFMATPVAAVTCKVGEDHCVSCMTTTYGAPYCSRCEEGWEHFSDERIDQWTCHKLPEHCRYMKSGYSCTSCEDGFYPTGSTDPACAPLLEHCVEQRYIDGVRSCRKCETGWVVNSTLSGTDETGCYKQTVAHCAEKTDEAEKREKETGYKQCSDCGVGYGLLYPFYSDEAERNDQQCVPCEDKNAVSCSADYKQSQICKSGYVNGDRPEGVSLLLAKNYKNGIEWCHKKIPNCLKYKAERITDAPCAQCESGYTPSADGKSCVKGTPCPENAACSDGNVTCNSGYVLKDGACVKCPANCSACSSSTACTACNAGYSLIGGQCAEGTVAKCPDDSAMSSDGCCCIPN